MGTLNTSSDQLGPDAGRTMARTLRLLARICLVASLSSFLLASLSLMVLPQTYGNEAVLILVLIGLILLVMSIVAGLLAGQWFLVSFVVAAIVVIGLTFLLPSLLRTRHPYESVGVANLRTINTAEVTYLSQSGSYGTIQDLIDARLLDEPFTGTKAGYNYTITLDATGSAYTAEAVPAPVVPKPRWWFSSTDSTTTPRRYGYYSLPDAIVRYSMDASLAPEGQSGRSVQ